MKTLITDTLEKAFGRLVKHRRIDDKHSTYLIPTMGGYVGVNLIRDNHSFVFSVISNDLGEMDTFQVARVFVGNSTKLSGCTKIDMVKAIHDSCEAAYSTYSEVMTTK